MWTQPCGSHCGVTDFVNLDQVENQLMGVRQIFRKRLTICGIISGGGLSGGGGSGVPTVGTVDVKLVFYGRDPVQMRVAKTGPVSRKLKTDIQDSVLLRTVRGPRLWGIAICPGT